MGKSNEVFVTTVLIKEDLFLSIPLSDQSQSCFLLEEVESVWGLGAKTGRAAGVGDADQASAMSPSLHVITKPRCGRCGGSLGDQGHMRRGPGR